MHDDERKQIDSGISLYEAIQQWDSEQDAPTLRDPGSYVDPRDVEVEDAPPTSRSPISYAQETSVVMSARPLHVHMVPTRREVISARIAALTNEVR